MPKPQRTEKLEEECVSLSQVNELLHQQKDAFTTLLQQQRDNFQSCVKIFVDSVNTRLDILTKELQEVKVSLQYTQKDVDDLKENCAKQTERSDTMQSDIYKVCDSLLTLTDKMEYLEGQSRRNNLVFDGIAESPSETWIDTEEKVRKVLKEKLHLERPVEVERAHRVGAGVGERPRPIVVKLLRYKDRIDILKSAKSLKGTNIYINEDYTDAVRRKRKDLLPELKAARARGDIAFLRHDKLIIRPRSSTPIRH